VLDGAGCVAEPWPEVAPATLALMQRLKARFDPDRTFRPGAFVGGI
jgi:glycolate oxidase FAD binding subunit